MLTGVPIQKHIVQERERLQLRAGVEGLAPDEVFTTMCLAGFRGVAVDYIWVKVLNLQLKQQWHEVRALTELIAKLQPHFPTVWVFNAWNLTYNISVEWVDPKDQWKWVKEGLTYLDEGLQRNPESIQLFFEKGWIFWHKMNMGPSGGPKDYFRKRLMEDPELDPEGKTPYALAADWFRLAQLLARRDDPENQHPFLAKGQVEAMYYRALLKQAQERLEQGDLKGTRDLLAKVQQELVILMERDGQKFGHVAGFDRDYRDVTQKLWRLDQMIDRTRGL